MEKEIYFKIVNQDLTFTNIKSYHPNTRQYKMGLNICDEEMDDDMHVGWSAGVTGGGYYFKTKDDIVKYYSDGDCLAVIELPTDRDDLKIVNERTNILILKEVRPLSDIDTYDKFGLEYPHLCLCAMKGYFGLVQYLVTNGATKDTISMALVSSVLSHNLDIIKYLLESGADINYGSDINNPVVIDRSNFGLRSYWLNDARINPLIIAALVDYEDIAKFLVENGADIHAYDGQALLCFARYGNLGMVKYLVDHGADIHAKDDHALYYGVMHEHVDVFNYLINHGANIHAQDGVLLPVALGNGLLDIAKYLLANGVSINTLDGKALLRSVKYEQLASVKFLIENGADIHARCDGAIIRAVDNNDHVMVKYLLEQGADIHAQNGLPIIIAARSGYLKLVKFLVENGADIHANNDDALVKACYNNRQKMVKFLVENGANVNTQNGAPLLESINDSKINIVKYLVENGADIHADDDAALKFSIIGGHRNVAQYLVDNGANTGCIPDELKQKLKIDNFIID